MFNAPTKNHRIRIKTNKTAVTITYSQIHHDTTLVSLPIFQSNNDELKKVAVKVPGRNKNGIPVMMRKWVRSRWPMRE